MPDFLKGNYKVDTKIEDTGDAADSTDEFEKKALSRLGGSICFVSKKSLIWHGEAQPKASRADTEDETAKAGQEAKARQETKDGTRKKDRPRA
jgi:hypothetical protein